MRDKNMEEIMLKVRLLEHKLKECSELLSEVGGLLVMREFAQAADLEAPAVEYPREGLAVDGEPEEDGIEDEKAPWE